MQGMEEVCNKDIEIPAKSHRNSENEKLNESNNNNKKLI
jgi:hypothetical protein